MERPALLVLVRHAESARNQAKKGSVYFADEEARRTVKGIPDHKVPITEEGIRQAELTGLALRRRFGRFDYAYHSGYTRTTQTLEHILSAWPEPERSAIHARHNVFIRERDPGYAYDMTEGEAEAAFPWLHAYWQTFGGFFARPVGGESLAQVAERVYLFLNMLFRERQGQKILVVTHGGTLRCFRYLLERWDFEQALHWPPGQSPRNCGITVYSCAPDGQRMILDEYNTTYYQPPEVGP